MQPQGDHIELHQKRNGYRLDHFERKRKKQAREVHERATFAQKVRAFSCSTHGRCCSHGSTGLIRPESTETYYGRKESNYLLARQKLQCRRRLHALCRYAKLF